MIGSLRVTLGIDTAAFSDGLKQARSTLKTVGGQMMKVGAAMSAVGAGLSVAIKSQINSADEMGKAAQKFGVPIEALSQLAYAGSLSDVSLGQVGTALSRLSKNMVGFGEDAEGAVAAFARVGVSATDAAGNLRPTNDVLFDLADAFASMADGPAKTAAAIALMGRSGAEMIPLLNGGGAALRGMMQEADALGLTISGTTAKAAEDFNDNITTLQATVSGIATQVAGNLAPALARLSEIAIRVSEGFRNLSPKTQQFLTIGTALSIALGPVVVALGLLVVGIAAIGVPIAAAIAGIVAITAALVAFWPEILAVKDAMTRLRVDGIDWLITKFGEFEDYLLGLKATFSRIGGEIIDGLLQGLKAKWESVKAWFIGLADSIPGWVKKPLGIQSPSTVFEGIGQNMMQGLAQGIASETDGIQDEVQTFAQDVASTLKGVLTGAMSVREGLGGILGNLGDSLLSKGISGAFGAFGIPGFANGTNFAPGGLAMVGERGPELVSLPRGARVTPNDRMGGNVVTLNVNVVGARGNTEVRQMVSEGVQQGMAQVRKEVPGIVVNTQKRAG